MGRHKFETVEMQNIYCWIELASIQRRFRGTGCVAMNNVRYVTHSFILLKL